VLTVLHELEDDVQVVLRADRVNVLDDVGVVQLLQKVDLQLHGRHLVTANAHAAGRESRDTPSPHTSRTAIRVD
jgi:hypothetical protein